VADPGFQTVNFGFQGVGQFGFQTGVQVVIVNQGTFNLRPGRRKRKKILDEVVEISSQKEYVAPEEVIPLENIQALAKELAVRGFPLSEVGLASEEDEEDELLAVTVRLLQ
jgi:hypothetical protein